MRVNARKFLVASCGLYCIDSTGGPVYIRAAGTNSLLFHF
jgi:hypothetical protein